MAIAAFFDIDGTLYRDQLMLGHFKKLIKYEVLDSSVWHSKAKAKYDKWDMRKGDFEEYLLEIAEIYINSIKGLNKQDIDFVTKQTIDLLGSRVYKFTRKQIEWHLEQGHKVIFISGGPDFLVEGMSKRYKATDFVATQYLVDDNGLFTGELVPMWESKDKIVQLKNFVKKYDIDLKESYAYGDTNGDLSMCKQVGKPCVINPNLKLITNIQSDKSLLEKTRIIVERKDVIYEVPTDVKVLNK